MQFLGINFFNRQNLMQSRSPIRHQVVLGIGIDLVEIVRIKRAIERWGARFEKRIFTVQEIDYCSQTEIGFQRFAARFAAKEAIRDPSDPAITLTRRTFGTSPVHPNDSL